MTEVWILPSGHYLDCEREPDGYCYCLVDRVLDDNDTCDCHLDGSVCWCDEELTS